MKKPWERFWPGAGLLLLVTLLAYLPALQNGYVWEDDYMVSENPLLEDLDGLHRIWFDVGARYQYYPLVYTTYWLEHHLWGLNPMGYHAVNILLHALNAVLLWVVLRRLRLPGAWFAGLLFALHPVQVMSVAWITERKNVLSGAFYLATILAFLRFAGLDAGTEGEGRPPGAWKWYGLTLLLFALALFSKTVVVTLPVTLLLLLWWKRPRLRLRRDLAPLLPFFGLSAAFGLLTWWMEATVVGTRTVTWPYSLPERFLIAGRAFWMYIGKLAWPARLLFFYPKWTVNSGAWWQYLFPLAALALVVVLWRQRHRWGKGPLVAVLVFGVTLAPTLGFVKVYMAQFSFVLDHWQYLAGMALIAFFAAGCARTVLSWKGAGEVFMVAVALLLGLKTWTQAGVYRNEQTLWEHTLAHNPDAWLSHNNLANILVQQGRVQEAIYHYERCLRVNPGYAFAQNNLGGVLLKLGRVQEALPHLEEAIRLDPALPGAYMNLGLARLREGDDEEAVSALEKSVELDPEAGLQDYYLALALRRVGRDTEAIGHLERATALRPADEKAPYQLARVMVAEGRAADAVAAYRTALARKPRWAQALNDLAWLLATAEDPAVRDPAEAVRLAEEACRLTRNRAAVTLDTLAAACEAAGRREQAIAAARQALKLARAQGQKALADKVTRRLEGYEKLEHPTAP